MITGSKFQKLCIELHNNINIILKAYTEFTLIGLT